MTSPVLNGLRIGITIGLRAPTKACGQRHQAERALAKLLMASPRGVTLVNTTDVPLTDALPWDRHVFDTRTFDDMKDSLDVVIETGGQVNGADGLPGRRAARSSSATAAASSTST